MRVLGAAVAFRYDLVHAHWPVPAGVCGAMLSAVRGTPFVLTSHGAYLDDFCRRSGVVRSLVQWVLRRADVVIAVSPQHSRNIREIAGLAEEEIRIIDMGVALPDGRVGRAEARRRLGLPVDEPIVIFVGNLQRDKGPDLLISAAALLQDGGLRCQILLAGQGPQRHVLVRMIATFDLGETVRLVGAIPPHDVHVWLSAADICVVPSRRESFGIVAMEAMASGTAVLAADVGGLRDHIKDGVNGFLFGSGDREDLAIRLRELLSTAAMRQVVVEGGKQTAAQHSVRAQAGQVAHLYRELLDKRNRGTIAVS